MKVKVPEKPFTQAHRLAWAASRAVSRAQYEQNVLKQRGPATRNTALLKASLRHPAAPPLCLVGEAYIFEILPEKQTTVSASESLKILRCCIAFFISQACGSSCTVCRRPGYFPCGPS